MNSGFAKFDTSWGYDPFTKPMNLTWFSQPTSIAGITNLVVGGILRTPPTGQVTRGYTVGVNGELNEISVTTAGNFQGPDVDSVIGVSSVQGFFRRGAGMAFWGTNEKLYLGGDTRIVATGSVGGLADLFIFDGASSVIGNTSFMVPDTPHPLKQFAGKLVFGNGPSVGLIDVNGIPTSSVFTVASIYGNQYSELFPPLPNGQNVRDLDVSIEGNYLNISATDVDTEVMTLTGFDSQYAAPGNGGIYSWNGIDRGITTSLTVPAGTATALQVYLQHNILFLNDTFGSAVSDGINKKLTLPRNKSPYPNATSANGNFLTWMCPENTVDGQRVGSLYYFGSLDEENPHGLYRLLRFSAPIQGGFVYQVPYNQVVSNSYYSIWPPPLSDPSSRVVSYGKHYFSTSNRSSVVSNSSMMGGNSLMVFRVTSDPSLPLPPQLGVYETQTQLFSKRIGVTQVRVYCEPTVAGNAFQLDLIGADGSVIPDGSYMYFYGDILDPQSGTAAVERINFPGNIKTQYALGVRLTNTGTTNMTIKKVEIDLTEEGK